MELKGLSLLRWLASPRWMLVFFVFAMAGALVTIRQPERVTLVWTVPLALFAVTLLAAVATNRRFRHDAPLLGLHLGLLMLVVLVALARLTYLDAAVTLTHGAQFDGQLQQEKRGPLHPGGIERLRFANEDVIEDFPLGARWAETRNRVRWWDEAGVSRVAEIGDDRPLHLAGYRIYTTRRNRGYSPLFHWQPVRGAAQMGNVQLGAGEFDMANSWRLPDGPEIWAALELNQMDELRPGERRTDLGSGRLEHRLIVRSEERREVLQVGGSMDFAQGRLTYVGLNSWMGYRITYDMSMYWMAAAVTLVVGCMVAYYSRVIWSAERTGTLKEGVS